MVGYAAVKACRASSSVYEKECLEKQINVAVTAQEQAYPDRLSDEGLARIEQG